MNVPKPLVSNSSSTCSRARHCTSDTFQRLNSMQSQQQLIGNSRYAINLNINALGSKQLHLVAAASYQNHPSIADNQWKKANRLHERQTMATSSSNTPGFQATATEDASDFFHSPLLTTQVWAEDSWDDMSALLSFDGEAHKDITRRLHSSHVRIEDMFASWDGDDFEAVKGRQAGQASANEQLAEAQAAAAAAAASNTQATGGSNGSRSSSSSDTAGYQGGLYLAVLQRRAAAMAAERRRSLQARQSHRAAALGSLTSADNWMLDMQTTISIQNLPLPHQQQHLAAGTASMPTVIATAAQQQAQP